MISKGFIFIILFITLLQNEKLQAQEKLTLDECIQYTLENNLDIKSQSLRIMSDKERLEQSKRNRLPYIGASSGYNVNFGKSVDPNTNDVIYTNFASNSYSLNSSVTLFDGFVKNNQIAYNRYIYLAGIEETKTLKADIAFEVMNAFYNVLYYKGLLDIANSQKELSELNLQKVKKQAEIGVSARTDILEIDARLAEEELQVIKTQNQLTASVLKLKRVMNVQANKNLEIQDLTDVEFVWADKPESADSVYRLALQHLPAVKAKNQKLKAIEKTLAISKGNLFPALSLGGGYNTGFYETRTDGFGNTISFRNQIKNNASRYLGVSLSFPVFNRWNTRSDIKLMRFSLENEKVNLQNYKNQLYYEIEFYCQELAAISAEYIQAEKQTLSNELAFEVAEKKKEQGMINLLDFYTCKNLMSYARGELLRTKLQYLIKRKTLDFYLGKAVFGRATINE